MVNVYVPPPTDETPATRAEADYQNVVGRQNRASVGLGSNYGEAANYQPPAQQQQQPVQQVQQQQQQANINPQGRPGYYDPSSLGDRATQQLLYMTDMQRQVFGQMGIEIASRDELTGKILEGQRKAAEKTPGTQDDQFYANELAKWTHNPIEVSSEIHRKELLTGQPYPANPAENAGDVALAFEKGGNLKDFTQKTYGFNPNVGGMIGVLPQGQGLQETAWRVAKTGEPANVDFMPAVDYLNTQKGRYGPYGALAGGIPDRVQIISTPQGTPAGQYTESNAKQPFVSAMIGTGNEKGMVGKDWNPMVVSAAEPIGYISEGIQIPSAPKETPPGLTMLNAVSPEGTWNFYGIPIDVNAVKQSAHVISGEISGGINFAFSIPVGIASLATFGIVPQWRPKDLEVVIPSSNPIRNTTIFGETTHVVSGGNETIVNLGTRISADKQDISARQSEIETLLRGNVTEGKYSGTQEGYTRITEKIAASNELVNITNKNVDIYNTMQKENPIIDTATTPQTVITTGTPDKVYPFGYWQMASEGIGNLAMGALGYNRKQLEAYGQTIKSQPGIGGETNRAVYTIMKPAIEEPLNLPIYYLEGRIFAGVAEGAGGAIAGYGQGAGKLSTVANVLTTKGEGGVVGTVARTAYNWAFPTALVAGGAYEMTNKGTDFSKETVLTNIESSVIPMALMTYGAMGTEPITKVVDYTKVRFQEKPMIHQTFEGELKYTQQPDIQVQSGIGGNLQYTQTETIATQPSFLGISLPRLFNPIERGAPIKTTVDLGYGDTGRLTEARLPGATTNPVVGVRAESLVLDTYRGGYVQEGPYQYTRPGYGQGAGNVKVAEVRLPRTFDEYLKMGAEDAKLTGQPQEVITAQLMADATKVTEPVTGYRELSVTVPAGTPIREAFDWTINKQGGKEVVFNKVDFEDYFGKMQVKQTGQAEYQIDVTRDVTEQGFLKGGSYDVTGTQVPETKIVQQLQEASKSLKPGPETAYAFDNRGNIIHVETGEIGSVGRDSSYDALANIEGTGSFAHTHPPYPISDYPGVTAKISELVFEAKGMGRLPSKSDMNVHAHNAMEYLNPHAVTAEYIVSKKGVSIMREPSAGWGTWGDIGVRSPQFVEDYSAADISRIEKQGGLQFVDKNQPYKAPGITERIPDVTAEMQKAYPVGVRTQFVDMIDRTILKDPNLEFIRDQMVTREKSLLESGSNLGRGGAGITLGGGRLVQASQQVQAQEAVKIIHQPKEYRMPKPSEQITRPVSGSVLVFAQTLSQIPSSKQSQNLEPRFLIEPVKTFKQPSMQVPQSDQMKEYAKVFTIGNRIGLAQIPEQKNAIISTQDVWQTPISGQQQTPLQEQAQIQKQQQITRFQNPPPFTQETYTWKPEPPVKPGGGLPFYIPPSFGGSAGYPYQRRGRRFVETFHIGLDIAALSQMGVKPKKGRPKKGRLIPAKRSRKK